MSIHGIMFWSEHHVYIGDATINVNFTTCPMVIVFLCLPFVILSCYPFTSFDGSFFCDSDHCVRGRHHLTSCPWHVCSRNCLNSFRNFCWTGIYRGRGVLFLEMGVFGGVKVRDVKWESTLLRSSNIIAGLWHMKNTNNKWLRVGMERISRREFRKQWTICIFMWFLEIQEKWILTPWCCFMLEAWDIFKHLLGCEKRKLLFVGSKWELRGEGRKRRERNNNFRTSFSGWRSIWRSRRMAWEERSLKGRVGIRMDESADSWSFFKERKRENFFRIFLQKPHAIDWWPKRNQKRKCPKRKR